MTGQNFLKGAFILSLAGVTVKLMGALYRIPLARLIGGEGMGLYQMAYPVYTMILALSTAGIPVAISILVAEKNAREDYQGGKRVFWVSLMLLTVIGAMFSVLLYFNSYWLAGNVLYDERAFYAIIAISPAIFITAITSAFRGYFQGNQTMLPTALSQVFEQLIRVATVLTLAYLLLPYGIEFAAAGATFGAVTGSIGAALVLILFYIIYRGKYGVKPSYRSLGKEPIISIMLRIGFIAVPLSLGGLVMPVMQLIDATIVPLRLQVAGYSIARATELFGQFSGMANTLINLPTIITISLAVSLVPAVSEALANKNIRQARARIGVAIWITCLLCLPAAVGLWLLATPIAILLYDIAEVGSSIAVLAPAALLLGLYQTSSGALQGTGKTYLPVKNLLIGIMIKAIFNYILVAMPGFGIKGAGYATAMGFTVAVILNYRDLQKNIGFTVAWYQTLVVPLIGVIIMSFAVLWSYGLIFNLAGNSLAVLTSILIGGIVYGLVILFFGGVKASELEIIPGFGLKLTRILLRLKIVRR
ncbi:MAG: polysaccharide biosynthesis protein [Clostridia bacterium]|nr:polysaccharide biosynthesis protein [Clostridia bacterium]